MSWSSPLFGWLKNTVEVSRTRGGLCFHWSRRGIGFGLLTLTAKRGKLHVDDECMGPEFSTAIVRQAIRQTERERREIRETRKKN